MGRSRKILPICRKEIRKWEYRQLHSNTSTKNYYKNMQPTDNEKEKNNNKTFRDKNALSELKYSLTGLRAEEIKSKDQKH